MTDKPPENIEEAKTDQQKESRIHQILIRILLAVMSVEGIYMLYRERWLSSFLVFVIVLILVLPLIFKKRLQIIIPAEFHIAAILFAFASLYLGEIQHFYERLWWWDIALHASAGLLMGTVGFLMVYIMNESTRVSLYVEPGFIAFFAYLFAISIGTFWEIFEFSVDSLAGTSMQKPMLGDPSGLTDTMWDMIVNAVGASLISILGWWYLKTGQNFFVLDWIRSFIENNPSLFRK